MSFERIYDSTWHHPVLFWAVGGPVLLLLLLRLRRGRSDEPAGRRFLRWALPVMQLEILLDAWLTSPWSPLDRESTAMTAAAVTFVILGDLRYFVLLQRFRRGGVEGSSPMRWLTIAIAASLVVPIASRVLTNTFWPGADLRVLFLVYESMFATLAMGIRFVLLRDGPGLDYVRALTGYEIAHYLGWASADILILSGYEVGFLLRLVPNTMYYAGFVPFALVMAPKELRP